MTDTLLNRNFVLVATGNFFLFLSFYALMPLLPFYLTEQFSADGTAVGLVLSCYMVSCIVIRPYCGYLLDTMNRRPVYILSYLIFSAVFSAYALCATLWLFILLRVIHGASFGCATVSGGSLVTQVIPRNRLGEGIGYYGLANTISMCIGPLLGLYAYRHLSFTTIFLLLTGVAIAGTSMASLVMIPPRSHRPVKRITLDSFFIKSGLTYSIIQILAYVSYGATTTYIAVFADQNMVGGLGGWYFTCMAVGLAISRPFAGKRVDSGNIEALVFFGLTTAIAISISLFSLHMLPQSVRPVFFLSTAFIQGIGYGMMHPAFNTIFVRLTDEAHRGAATSMFFTSNDLGIGIGVLTGGMAAQYFGGYFAIYGIGGILCLISLIMFIFKRHNAVNKQ